MGCKGQQFTVRADSVRLLLWVALFFDSASVPHGVGEETGDLSGGWNINP
jgi:hypothetical protein